MSLLCLLAHTSWCNLVALADTPSPCEREMTHAARTEGIPLAVLYSVALTETGRRGRLNPYDMNVDGESLHFETLDDAIKTYRSVRAAGATLIDVGCMQINVRWHSARFTSIEDMFDPRRNVAYAARFLKELHVRHQTWTLAIARYNAGPNNNAAQLNYVCAVIRQLVASGMGSWTDDARRYCNARRPAAHN